MSDPQTGPLDQVNLDTPVDSIQVPVGDDISGEPAPRRFNLPVDANNKATVLKPWLFHRPHMRAFHFAWSSFFLAFFGWFAIAPLQGKISRHPNNVAWFRSGTRFRDQNIISVAGTILMRLLIGPFCDRFGPRLAQASLLGVFSIPVFLIGTTRNYVTWTTARFFIGFCGATFVVTQFWTSIMFSGNIVGTANATSAGWGNLGGGVTNALMPLIRRGISSARGLTDAQDKADDTSWRLAMIIPGCSLILIAASLFFLSDDLPEGNYKDLHATGQKEKTNPFKAMLRATSNWRVWVLFILYAGCFGIELIMNANLANYFSGNEKEAGVFLEDFRLNESTAGLIAGLFGIMNLFARSLGGIGSDLLAKKFGLRGRLAWFFFVQCTEGILFVLFSLMRTIPSAIPLLLLFSLFVQMSEGATFGIVPFVDPEATGAISGIVGAGGNFGAVTGGFLLAPAKRYGISTGFRNLGFIVIGTSFLILILHFPQYGSVFIAPKKQAQVEEVIDDEQAA